MTLIQSYAETARPRTLIASFAPITLVGILHFEQMKIRFNLFLMILVGSILIQIITNFFNDFYDYIQGQDTVLRIGPKRPFQRGDLTKKEMKLGILFLSLIYFLAVIPICFHLKSIGIFFSCLSYFLSIYYTKGNYSLAKLGLSDLFAFSFFGPISTTITGYGLTGQFSYQDILIGIITGSLSTILLVINHLRDEKEDRETKKTTSVVRFGISFGKFLIYFFCLNIVISSCLIGQSDDLSLIVKSIILISVVIFLRAFRICQKDEDFKQFLPKAAQFFIVQFFLVMTILWITHMR